MNPFYQQIIIDTVKRYYQKHPEKRDDDFRLKKRIRDIQIEIQHELTDVVYILIGVVSAAFGLKAFLIPNSFIDGGVMGISLICREVFQIPLAFWVVALNLPFIFLALRVVSSRFAIKSAIAIIVLAALLFVVDFPTVTNDQILVAAFGGVFLGLGIGMAIRGGAIIDGTEVLAIYISRNSSMTVGNVILVFNVIIFAVGAWVFTTEIALYAILTYFTASKTVDFVIDGIEEYMGVTIVSDKSEDVRKMIVNKLGRGCTILHGEKGFTQSTSPEERTNIIYTVITRLEMSRLKTEVDKIDKDAFMVMASVKDTKGGMIKRKPINRMK